MPIKIVKDIINEMVEAALEAFKHKQMTSDLEYTKRQIRKVAFKRLLETGYNYELLNRIASQTLDTCVAEAEIMNPDLKKTCYESFKQVNKFYITEPQAESVNQYIQRKTCRCCKEEKILNDFHKQCDMSDGRRSICRKCRSETEKRTEMKFV